MSESTSEIIENLGKIITQQAQQLRVLWHEFEIVKSKLRLYEKNYGRKQKHDRR